MLERDVQRSRAIQVGMLMRAYRESFPSAEGGRGLTQDELLRRMAAVDRNYAQRYSHTTVSRWESGATRPSRERLEVFGRALNLTRAEVEGLVALAGLGDQSDSGLDGPGSAVLVTDVAQSQSSDPDVRTVAAGDAATVSASELPDPSANYPTEPAIASSRPRSFPTIFQSVVSCLLPALATIGGAYLLASLGWNEMWMPIAYIGAVVGIRLGAAFLRMSNPYDLCEFFCISVFVLLTTPLLQSAALSMDHYGFSAIGTFGDTPMPYMLALLVNLALSTVAGGVFCALWNWQYGVPRQTGNPVRRAASVVVLPIGLVYATMAVITNTAIVLQLGVSFAVLTAVCIVLLLMRDASVAPDERDRRFLLWAILIVGMVLTTIGAAVMLTIYLTPNLPAMLPDHNLLYSWAIDFDRIGLSPEETLQRFNVGYLWHATSVFVYMVFVVGGNLVAAAYRWGHEPPHTPGGGPMGNSGEPTAPSSILGKIIGFLTITCWSFWYRPRGSD